MRRAIATAAITVLALAGCAGTDDEPDATATTTEATSSTPSPSESVSPTESATPSAQPTDDEHEAIEIEIEGHQVEPNGRRVKVAAGEPIILEIESDRAGELHVHSSPEQLLAFKKGESRIEFTIDRPGVVDVEEHEAHTVVLQLEVS